MTRKKHGADASSSSPSPQERAPQTGARLETGRNRTSRNGAVAFTIIVFAAVCALVLACAQALAGSIGLAALVIAAVVGALAASSVHIVMEWERAVVMRFGRFNRVAGPGIVFTWPVIEFYTVRIDQRVAATYFGAEETLTADLVPVTVDAVLFWMVWDAEKACLEVENYYNSVSLAAQTALRDAIGRASLSNVVMRRHQLDQELREAVEEKVSDWGISIVSVEVRDLIIPKELQGVMSLEAQAECRKSARITLMEAERDVSEILDEVAQTYNHDEVALALRKLHLTYEGMQDNDSTLVVPSAYSEGFNVKADESKSL